MKFTTRIYKPLSASIIEEFDRFYSLNFNFVVKVLKFSISLKLLYCLSLKNKIVIYIFECTFKRCSNSLESNRRRRGFDTQVSTEHYAHNGYRLANRLTTQVNKVALQRLKFRVLNRPIRLRVQRINSPSLRKSQLYRWRAR